LRSASIISYEVSVVDEPIAFQDGRSYAQIAIVEKFKGANKISSQKLGVADLEKVYSDINKNEELNLSNCYLKDFSLDTYRKLYGLSEGELVNLHSLKADNAFFESDFGTSFAYSNFEGTSSSFAYSIFHKGKVNFGHAKCSSNLNFNRVEFYNEELSFKFAEFDKGDIRFSSCIFDCEDLLFVNTNFGEGNVSFRQTDFRESNCNFQYAQFNNGDVSFDKSIFAGQNLDFRKIEFGDGKADFRRVNFGDGDINFSESEFGVGKISFRSSLFGTGEKKFENVNFGANEISFEGAKFENGLLSFKGAIFGTLSFADSRLNGHCDFRIAKGNVLDLTDAIVKDVIDIQAGVEKVDLKTWKIEGLKNMGKLFLSWEENNAFQLINSQTEISNFGKASQFNLLKETFHQNGKYTSEDKAYVAFKRFEMLSELEEGIREGGLKAIRARLYYGFKWLVFDKAGLFATAPLRVFTSMLFVLCFFAILYIILPHFVHAEIVSSVGDPDGLNLVERSFYHSAITFFTIGYGDYYPSGHVRWLSAAEGWAGVFLMSYFTVAFVRRILR